MAESIEADISDVIRAGLNQVLAKELGSNDFDVNIEMGSKKGDNFIGIVYRVNGKLFTDNSNSDVNNDQSSVNVFLKVAPTSKARREHFYARASFIREIKMYDEVLPMFREFQESKGIIPEENGFHEYPKCYKTIDSHFDETLILEDLKADQFEMLHRSHLITIDHARLVMKALGKYHALSFAFRDQQPEKFKPFAGMQEMFLREVNDSLKSYFASFLDSVFNSLDQEGDEQLLEKVKELFKRDHIAIMSECCTGELAEPYAVICHGDCWNHNVMFKYDETQKPVDLRLLDWQISRYASPATDLVYFIFCCTTKPVRDQYYDELIRTYHESLSEMLTRLGSDPLKLFPFGALQDQLRRFGKFGLIMATMILPMSTPAPEDCPDMDELVESFNNGDAHHNYVCGPGTATFNERMRDVIVDMNRLGYF